MPSLDGAPRVVEASSRATMHERYSAANLPVTTV